MGKTYFLAIVLSVNLVNGASMVSDSVNVPVFGKVYIYNRTTTPQNVVIMISGDGGWKFIELPKMLCEINGLTVKTLITLPKVGHGFAKWSDFMPQWKDAYSSLIAQYEKKKPAKVDITEVKNLPVIITNSKISDIKAPIALLISGDGGWYGFEQQIADNLAKYGIPTIGLDSKKYFWNRKTPEETASDIGRALKFYGKLWGREKFVLIGYSLGAEIVPFIVNRLQEEIKSNVQSTVLLSPATTTDFEIHISNMLGMGNKQNTYNTTEEIVKMQSVPTLIIFGEGEKTELPGLLSASRIVIRKIPGDHHYKFNLPLIMQTMRENKIF